MPKKESSKLMFQKLTPYTSCDITPYEEALDFVFEHEDLVNIAVTGAYGSGKSSIIRTYEKKSKKFIYISLAHFEDANTVPVDDKKINIEGKIINQLIHQIPPNNIPHSKFKIKRLPSTLSETFVFASFIALFATIALFIYRFDNYSDKKPLFESSEPFSSFLSKVIDFIFSSGFYFIGSLVLMFLGTLFLILFIYHKTSIKKLIYKGNEIHLFEESSKESDKENGSYFDQYLDELLYVLKRSKVDAIIFEDIDRYNSNRIFNKLREISCLVNCKQHGANVKFIYLIKDYLFSSTDRTKFFDFIIPVVPIMDHSNARDKFVGLFKAEKSLSQTFIKSISFYIDEMRTLNNICNEYILYKNVIAITDEENFNKKISDSEKLLGMIVYKNLFPKDFSDLQLRKGHVYKLLNEKEHLYKERVNNLNKEIQELEEEKEPIEKEHLEDIDELDALFVELPKEGNITIGGKTYPNSKALIKALKENGYDYKYKVQSYTSYTESADAKENFEKLEQDKTYLERLEILKKKKTNGILQINKEIDELKEEILKVKAMNLVDFINSGLDVFKLFQLNYASETDSIGIMGEHHYGVIRYMVANGYIDENYSIYINYLYTNYIPYNDQKFILSILEMKDLDYKHKLNEPEKLLGELDISNYIKHTILNFDLMDCMLTKGTDNKHLKVAFDKIIKDSKIDFIFQYMIQTKKFKTFINYLNKMLIKHNKNIWDFIHEKHCNEENLRKFIYYMLLTFSESSLEKLNKYTSISEKISSNKNFLDPIELNEAVDQDVLIKRLKILNVKFKSLNEPDKDLFAEVYKNNLYEINMDMISKILKDFYYISDKNRVAEKTYEEVSFLDNAPIVIYIEENINDFIESVINSTNVITDNEKIVKKLMYNDKLEIAFKEEYLGILTTEIEDINSIIEDLWGIILEKGNIKFSLENIMDYFGNNSLDDTLISFINESKEELYVGKEMDLSPNNNSLYELFDAIITNDNINDNKYEMILKHYDGKIAFEMLENVEISHSKREILVKLQILAMEEENIEFIREDKELLEKFLIGSISTYITDIKEKDYYDVELLLESNISLKDKKALIDSSECKISIIGKNYPENLKEYILRNAIRFNELSELSKEYEESSDVIKLAMLNGCMDYYINIIKGNDVNLSYPFLLDFIDKINESDKKTILFNYLDRLTNPQIKTLFEKAKLNKYDNIFQGYTARLKKAELDETDNKFIDYFIQKGWAKKSSGDEKIVSIKGLKKKSYWNT